jgi:hypothetical protein
MQLAHRGSRLRPKPRDVGDLGREPREHHRSLTRRGEARVTESSDLISFWQE